MTAKDLGTHYYVSVSEREVDEWNTKWPCSTLSGPQTFVFDKKNGDLVDRTGKGEGSEAVALSHDAQAYGKRKLNLE